MKAINQESSIKEKGIQAFKYPLPIHTQTYEKMCYRENLSSGTGQHCAKQLHI